jgi:pimeloyl-ACP methyl ester carboxylesterase
MLDDFLISGVIDQTAHRYRVIAFDRPGFGHSNRPSDRSWTPSARASVLLQACRRLGIDRPMVVAHAWEALVALALALDHPHRTAGLVLLSGCYFPKPRRDVALLSPPAILVLGGLLSYRGTAGRRGDRTETGAAAIIAGDADRIVDARQAQRLHGEIPGSRIDILQGASHMVHHVAPERVLRAIDSVAREGPTWRSPTT